MTALRQFCIDYVNPESAEDDGSTGTVYMTASSRSAALLKLKTDYPHVQIKRVSVERGNC